MRKIAAFTLLVAACSHHAQTATPAPEQQAPTTVQVQNQNTLDTDVYVVNQGQRLRLGTVQAMSTQTFTIPAIVLRGSSQVSFIIRPVGGTGVERTQTITVMPGDQVQMTIPPM